MLRRLMNVPKTTQQLVGKTWILTKSSSLNLGSELLCYFALYCLGVQTFKDIATRQAKITKLIKQYLIYNKTLLQCSLLVLSILDIPVKGIIMNASYAFM